MSNSTSTVGVGFGLPTILTIIFVVLKLTGNVAWSWLWVLSPLWIYWLVVISVVIIALLIAAVVH